MIYIYLYHLGSKFWRSNKKIKAMKDEDYNSFIGASRNEHDDDSDGFEVPAIFTYKKKRVSSPVQVISSSDDEYLCKPSTSRKKSLTGPAPSTNTTLLEERLSKLENNMKKFDEQTQTSDIKAIEERFICKSILSQNCSLLPCCNQLACLECLQQWTSTMTDPTCPLCRASVDVEQVLKPSTLPRSVYRLIEILNKTSVESTSAEN
jgi:hypothetical protein